MMRGLALSAVILALSFARPLGAEERPKKDPKRHWSRTPYSIKMAEEALPLAQLPKIIKGHPRLLIRTTPWNGGITVAELRERAKQQPWKKWFDWCKKSKPKPHQWRPVRALYYLATQDEDVVPSIARYVLAAKPQYNCGGGLVDVAIQYDWIYSSPILLDKQRRLMADKIAEVALKCAKIYESGWAFDIWTHRGSPGWAADVLAAALVLDDDHPQASKLRSWAMGYWKRQYFRAWQHNGGCWLHGGSSYNVGLILPRVIACWQSATDEDVYGLIKKEYDNWLQRHMYYMMSEVLPDRTRSDAIAWDYNPPGLRMPTLNCMMAARAYRDPNLYPYLRWLKRDPRCMPYSGMMQVLFYDEKLDKLEPTMRLDAPFSMIWGRRGAGYVQMRSKGWAPDSTVIEFKCGDFVWTHTHPNHSNSFWIYHKGRLAVQGGSYGADKCWHGGTGSHYFTQSISSNTMLIFQPGEFNHPGGPRAGDLEEPGVIPNPGGQRMRWALGQTCFTFDEYLRRKKELGPLDSLFETGDITAFERAKAYTYVQGDATMAYNNPKFCYAYKGRENKPKIDLFTRSMVYLPGTNDLVVFDRVRSLDPSWRKAWLCHFQGKPEVNGKIVSAQVPGHIEDFDGDTVRMTWADGVLKPPDPKDPGRLFIRTFLPAEHTIRRIGGDGYEAWSNGKNRTGDGHKNLKVDTGRWRIEVSPKKPARFDNFLHLIHICDTKTKKMPAAEMVAAKDEKMIGLVAGGWLVMFGTKGDVAGEVTYSAPKGKTEHLVVDLKREGKYKVTGIAGGEKEMTVSREGTLRFATEDGGIVKLAPVPSRP